MFPSSEANVFSKEKRVFKLQRPLNSSGDWVGFGEGLLWLQQGVCGYIVTMMMMKAVGNGGGGRVEVLGGGGKSDRNRLHQDDHR